ncbi:hypothetical protein [Streptomyces sp. NPDC001930]|uniref:hypothetical protein n=1 Tax=Streptomyces sp. NPDC001930 TaxID=3364625 RepID=UPI0036A57A73
MCGIAGWVDFGRDLTQERAIVDAMTQTMACRGPDADGVWIGQHGRTLAALTFSGEICNSRELRADLISRGHRFRTESDTEVVIRGYMEWGRGSRRQAGLRTVPPGIGRQSVPPI